MTVLFDEFRNDYAKIRDGARLLLLARDFKTGDLTSCDNCSATQKENTKKFSETIEQSRQGITIIGGTLVLYATGRFEHYIRLLVENIADSIAEKCEGFLLLPKEMRENLITQTALVVQNPRRYGHGEGARSTFLRQLSDNLNGNSAKPINSQCISITDSNMRPDILAGLFKRIGVKDALKDVSEQAHVKALFQSANTGFVQDQLTRKLNEVMDLRNGLAHSSGNVSWPAIEKSIDYMNFLEAIAGALDSLSSLYGQAPRKE